LPNGTAAILTSILSTGTPVVTPIVPIGAPVLATLRPGCPRLGGPGRLASSGRLGLSISCRQHSDWHCQAERRS
jgi:hypothetical protein